MLKTVGFPSGRTGDQTIVDGNLVIGTAGKGIDFSATPGTGTSELLADYEEGTFTPTLVTLGNPFTSVTYNADIFGRYTKVGKVITIQLYMRTDAITLGSASSAIAIGGLPFASGDKNGVSAVSGIYDWNTGPSGAVVFGGGDTRIGLQSRAALNGNMDYLTVANVLTGFGANQVFLTATYRTA